MAPPRGPRGGEKPKGQRQNRDPDRDRDDRRDEQSRATRWQDGRSRDRGRGGHGIGDGRGNPDSPSSGTPKSPVGVDKVNPGNRVTDSLNSKSNNKSGRGRDLTTRVDKPNNNRRRNPSSKSAIQSSLAIASGAIASRASPLESTRPQSRQRSPMPARELPKKLPESSARLHRFDSPGQNAAPPNDSAKTTSAKPAKLNTTWTKTARPTVAPAIATTQITIPEISFQPQILVGDAQNPFTAPSSELSRIMADLKSRIKPRPANQKRFTKFTRLPKETAEPSLNLSRPEVGRLEKAELEHHKPSTVGIFVDKLKDEVASRAEQESHTSIDLNSVANSNTPLYLSAPVGNPGAIGTSLSNPQRPTPSTPTGPRGRVSQNKSASQAPEPVPKLSPLVLEPWRRDPASLDMNMYRKKMADLYQKVCAPSSLKTPMDIERVTISPLAQNFPSSREEGRDQGP